MTSLARFSSDNQNEFLRRERGQLIEPISVPPISNDAVTLQKKEFKELSSYNWLDKETATIMVPGNHPVGNKLMQGSQANGLPSPSQSVSFKTVVSSSSTKTATASQHSPWSHFSDRSSSLILILIQSKPILLAIATIFGNSFSLAQLYPSIRFVWTSSLSEIRCCSPEGKSSRPKS